LVFEASLETVQSHPPFQEPENNRKALFQVDNGTAVVARNLQVKYTTRLVRLQLKTIEWQKSWVERSPKEGEV
jgi:hypothetical protein